MSAFFFQKGKRVLLGCHTAEFLSQFTMELALTIDHYIGVNKLVFGCHRLVYQSMKSRTQGTPTMTYMRLLLTCSV